MSEIAMVVKNGHSAPSKCPNCGSPHKHSDDDDYHEYKCRSFLWRGILNKETPCMIRQEAQTELQEKLERVKRQRNEAVVLLSVIKNTLMSIFGDGIPYWNSRVAYLESEISKENE